MRVPLVCRYIVSSRGFRLIPLAVALVLPGAAGAQTPIPAQAFADLFQARDAGFQRSLTKTLAALETDPRSETDLETTGQLLDLLGRSDQATPYYKRRLELAQTPEVKVSTRRMMGVSRAFAGDCKGAEAAETPAILLVNGLGQDFEAGEIADEIGRICLESGDLATARKWYSTGHGSGLREANITREHFALWEFRWLHAQARIAVRRGDFADAKKKAAAAVAFEDKGLAADQDVYIPYLKGYVALFSGDYQEAKTELEKAPGDDPFIQCLLGRALEGLGMNDQALAKYKFAIDSNAYSVNLATAVHWLRGRAEAATAAPAPNRLEKR